MNIELKVSGMKCNGCENRIDNALLLIDGIKEVKANHLNGLVNINSSDNIDIEEIKNVIEDLGFIVEG